MNGKDETDHYRTQRGGRKTSPGAEPGSVRSPTGIDRGSVSSIADRIEHELATTALRKRQAGETPTAREQTALRHIEVAREKRSREEHYRAIPQKDWRAMGAGDGQGEWQWKQLIEQSQRYGVPMTGETISLPAVVRWLRVFLAEHADVLDAAGGGHKALRIQRAELSIRRERLEIEKAELEVAERRGRLLPRDEVRAVLETVAARLRTALRRVGGSVADDVERGLTEAEQAFDRGT